MFGPDTSRRGQVACDGRRQFSGRRVSALLRNPCACAGLGWGASLVLCPVRFCSIDIRGGWRLLIRLSVRFGLLYWVLKRVCQELREFLVMLFEQPQSA